MLSHHRSPGSFRLQREGRLAVAFDWYSGFFFPHSFVFFFYAIHKKNINHIQRSHTIQWLTQSQPPAFRKTIILSSSLEPRSHSSEKENRGKHSVYLSKSPELCQKLFVTRKKNWGWSLTVYKTTIIILVIKGSIHFIPNNLVIRFDPER